MNKPAKSHYTELEAADQLGVSVEQLRFMIRSHIVDNEEDLHKTSIANFHPTDLLVLKLLGAPESPA